MNGALRNLDVLDVFKSDGCFMNDPDATPKSHAFVRHHVPGCVITQVNGHVRNNVRHDHHHQKYRRENERDLGMILIQRNPYDQQSNGDEQVDFYEN